jgi:chitinase
MTKMMNLRNWVCVLALLVVAGSTMAQRKEIIGYYPSWKWNSRGSIMTPARIPFGKLTMINYAFFYPLPDGRIVGRDTIGDDIFLRGEPDEGGGKHKTGTALVELAHQSGVKVLLSIGGWEDSSNFPEVAASETKRQQFAHSCVDRIREYDFDGIDIDWEYPGYAEHKGTPDDKGNLTRLLQITRDSLMSHGNQIGKKLFLTAALPAGASNLSGFDMEKVSDLLDMINVMTYDLSGTWDPVSGHNAPLFSPNESDSSRNIDAAFRLFTVTHNVPASKVNIGVPFYGHTFANCTAPYAPHSGSDTVHFSTHGCFYYDIVPVMDKFTRHWDDRAKVPYLVSQEWKTFISYDDEESVGHKAQYVLDQNAGGVIIWEITGDSMPDGKTPLLDVISGKLGVAKSKQ